MDENHRSDEMHKLMEEFRQLYKEKLERLDDHSGESEDAIKVKSSCIQSQFLIKLGHIALYYHR